MPDTRDRRPGNTPVSARTTCRIELTMHKPWFALYARVRPTLVIEGRGQPTQWGLGTWQVPADETVTVGVYLFNRVWRFGGAELTFHPSQTSALTYRAPALPFLRGRISQTRTPGTAP